MKRETTEHRWAVDGIEEGTARVEQDGREMLTVPRWLLPAEAREGQLLRVTRTAGVGSSTVVVSIDAAATEASLMKSKESVEKIAKASKKRDAGGDVAL